MAVLFMIRKFIATAVVTAALSISAFSAAFADNLYTLDQVTRHIESLYGDNVTVDYRIRDSYAYVYGLSDTEFYIVQNLVKTIERQTGQKIIVVNEQGDFGPEIDKHADFISFQDHMTQQVLKSPFVDEFTNTGLSYADFAKLVQEVEVDKGLVISKIVRSEVEPRDHIIQQTVILVEKNPQRLGYAMPFRAYALRILAYLLTGAGASNEIVPSAFNAYDVTDDMAGLQPIDVAYIRALYAHDNWAELSREEALDQLARTMMAQFSAQN